MYNHIRCIIPWSVVFLHQSFRILGPAHNIPGMIISEKNIPAAIHLHYHFSDNLVKSQDIFGLHSSGNPSIQVSTDKAITPCLSEVKNVKGVVGV
jgi:hypothetical protein